MSNLILNINSMKYSDISESIKNQIPNLYTIFFSELLAKYSSKSIENLKKHFDSTYKIWIEQSTKIIANKKNYKNAIHSLLSFVKKFCEKKRFIRM